MTALVARPIVGLLLCLPLGGMIGLEAQAAGPTARSDVCRQMVEHWTQKWSEAEVQGCAPWRKQRSKAFSDALGRCLAKHQFDENTEACEPEQSAFTHFQNMSYALESVAFQPKAHGLFPQPQTGPTEAERAAAAEKADADRRAKRRQEIIDSFGNGTPVPTSTR